ncbi:MAG: phosphate ABC transporter permease PstA [Ignavibacteria bacterium]|jgi:phosphate transport system permease protein
MKMSSRDIKSLIKDKNNKDFKDLIVMSLIRLFTYSIIAVLFLILGKIVYEGSSVINWEFITSAPKNNMTEGGIGPAIFGTIVVVFLMVLFAVPVGVFAAIYMSEYAKDNLFNRILRITVNNLAGVPSIVFGLFGLGFFVLFVGRGYDTLFNTGLFLGKPAMLWASATLAILVLPTIIVSSIEALKAVPKSQRVASLGLGASKWQTIKTVVFPQARSGILTGIILSISRGAGETAPLLFLGCAFFLPQLPVAYFDMGFFSIPMINPAEQFMYLSYHIFILATQSTNPTLTMPIQYGTTMVLISIVILLNLTAIVFRYKFRQTMSEIKRV